ncbi:MAG: aminomethyl-transferring glycine dehydrogenase subunit GcvPB [Caldisericia bacterium]|nr:aminomethyl-transferring glycine dehydrogenase subunit GcvPB [Caldisericia bacterium]
MKTLKELSKHGSNKFNIEDDLDFFEVEKLENEYLREEVEIPDISEINLIRHFINLSKLNYGVDVNFYPLGSCTMKYNPKINEDIAKKEDFYYLHPLLSTEYTQGILKILWEMQEFLKEITGMDGFTLQPAAGAHGEYTGLRIMWEYFKDKKERRNKVILPDSAHGTNPASSSMLGLEVIEIQSKDGMVDPDKLKDVVDEKTFALMLTNPNTLGFFEKDILKISEILKSKGALLYYDGANLNGFIGIARPGDMGFDCVHLNLHKTFSTPHGGGGPGSGPVGVKDFLVKYLPYPVIEKSEDDFFYFSKPERTIGKVRSFFGNFSVILKAYLYIRELGSEGLKEVAQLSVLNANYIKEKLKKYYPSQFDRVVKHECVLSGKIYKEYGVKTLDIAKRLMDYGFHPPTIYFPHIVDEALMIEPTETESKETLDEFIEVMIKISEEIKKNPELVKNAPHTTYISRPDEVKAAKELKVKW